jgi:hypothetical protein
VGNWAAGRRSPTPAVRRAIAKRYDVKAGLWTSPPTADAAPTLPEGASAAPSTARESSTATNATHSAVKRPRKGTTRPPPRLDVPSAVYTTHGKPDPQELAQRLVSRIEKELELAQGNAEYSPRERASLASAGTSALRLYSRLAGSLEVTQASIVRSAAWGRILRAFERVFSRHPEAAKALAEFTSELREIGE